jgi:hypothetical protein
MNEWLKLLLEEVRRRREEAGDAGTSSPASAGTSAAPREPKPGKKKSDRKTSR